jgi:hypothetical protein
MEPGTRLSVPAHVISRSVGDEAVLLDLQSGLYFGVDPVGRRIWELAAGGSSLGEIVEAILAEFDVERPAAEADVLAFVSLLVERGLLAE